MPRVLTSPLYAYISGMGGTWVQVCCWSDASLVRLLVRHVGHLLMSSVTICVVSIPRHPSGSPSTVLRKSRSALAIG